MPSAYSSRPGTRRRQEREKSCRAFYADREKMTKELRRGTVAWWMGAHTFHGCFRDKRYAGHTDTRGNEPREEQSASPGSLVLLQPHANPFVSQTTTTMSRTPSAPSPERARAHANSPRFALQFRQYVAMLSRLNLVNWEGLTSLDCFYMIFCDSSWYYDRSCA